jgi:hypothetical protein
MLIKKAVTEASLCHGLNQFIPEAVIVADGKQLPVSFS